VNLQGGIWLNQLAKALTPEEAVERARSLAIKIKPRLKLTEELSRQPEENIQDFIDSGLVRIMTPKNGADVS
jgi:3-hydroxy-9,10-secoandrosta-1,3,5(10)-triene-9,17-dione monooxygenase